MSGLILAHGIGGRTDLPLPAWQLAWAAGFAVAISFVALGTFWERPTLERLSHGRALWSTGAPAPRLVVVVCRAAGLFGFGVVLFAAFRGNTNEAVNIAGDAFLIWFWVGLQFASAVLGDVWALFNPYLTIADGAAWLRARRTDTDMSPVDRGRPPLWVATGAIAAYAWYELAYHSAGSPRAIGVFLTLYSVFVLGGAARFGRGWARGADGFAVLFGKLGAIGMFHVEEGRLRVRPPLTGVSTMANRAGSEVFILFVLGSTTFDGFTRSSLWLRIAGDAAGWSKTLVSTIGLVSVAVVIWLAYLLAINVMSGVVNEDPPTLALVFAPSLVPIAAAYSVAHYFSLLVLDGQRIIIQVSDPLGRGWDLFGTKDYAIDWLLVSPQTIAWVQTLAIALGHVLAVAAAHDRAVGRWPYKLAVRSQYPMLGVMITYTVTGLFLLLGA